MFKRSKPLVFTLFYSIVCIVVMNLVFIDNKTLQFYFKPLVPLSLLLFYYFSVKKVDATYVLMILSVFSGHMFMIFPQEKFVLCLCFYLIFHLLITYLVYKKFLLKKSMFNIFTFALPFFMSFLTIFLLIYKNLHSDLIPVFLFGTMAAINGSVVLLNYSQKQNVTNYLIFIGLFTIIASDASGALYRYGEKDILFYYLLVLLDQFGQYAICRGIIFKQKQMEVNIN